LRLLVVVAVDNHTLVVVPHIPVEVDNLLAVAVDNRHKGLQQAAVVVEAVAQQELVLVLEPVLALELVQELALVPVPVLET
jgi:hypothetical protein